MKLLRPLAIAGSLLLLVGAAWVWWNLPTAVDMADYAPADSFLYLEINSLTEVVNAIQQNETWKGVAPLIGSTATPPSRWLTAIARAGIGPARGVIFSRAQFAVVVTGMNRTAEQNDVLRVKPEIAVIVETHTSKWRTWPAAVEAVKRVANFAYGESVCTERSLDADYVECSAVGVDRRIIGAVDGSLVVIGNTEKAVRNCLEVRRGLRPSIRTDPELLKVRSNLSVGKRLSFGYISSANAAKLFAMAGPLLIGRAPGDQQLEQVLESSATKILRGVAWTSSTSMGGIEDRFLITLDPAVVKRLEPAFETAAEDDNFWKLVPDTFQSLTIYRTKDPPMGWSAIDSAVALKLDALSAVLFGSLLRSSLSVYGIDNPKAVLTTLLPPLLTVKPASSSEGSVLLARVRERDPLRRALATDVFKNSGQILESIESEPDSEKEFTAVFTDEYVFIGKTENIRPCLIALRSRQVMTSDGKLKQVQHFASQTSSSVRTYSNDEARLTSFVTIMALLEGKRLSVGELDQWRKPVMSSSYSFTETNLNSSGIERKTRSAFGLFSTLLSLAQSDSSNPLIR